MSWPIAEAAMAKGWVVFPVRDKKPLIKWKEGACRTWESWPEGADVGLPTGARNGIVVIDDDRAKFELPAWEPPIDTYHTSTRSGGMHWYFLHPGEPVKNSVGKVAQHVDVRGDGGYVVLYEVADAVFSPIPENMLPVLMKKPQHAVWLDPAHRQAFVHTLLTLPPWPEGERNFALFKMACVFFENSMDVAPLWHKAMQSGLNPTEAERTIASARARVVQ